MRDWLKSLLGGGTPAASTLAPASARPPGPGAAADPERRDAPADAPPAPTAFGPRRPLIAAGGGIAGFEFELPLSAETRRHADADQVAQAAQTIALLSSMRSTLASGRIALASLPAAMLARPAVAAQAARGTMLAIGDNADGRALSAAERSAIGSALRARGVQVGVPAASAGSDAAYDFIMLDAASGGIDALLKSARARRLAQPGVVLVATNFQSIDEIEQALQGGITLAAGRFDAMGATHVTQQLQPAMHRIYRLLNAVVTDQDTAVIAQDIRTDVALAYRLLRYGNSAALGLARAVESIDQALLLLGRKELYRWLSILLLFSADGRRASRALQEIALARARLLETLARERGSDPPEVLFTVGLLSLLHVMLQVPLADALQPLRLGDAARQALLEGRGEWHDYLALATDLERQDLAAAAARAAKFGGLAHVLESAEEAWRWAAAVLAEGHD